MKSLEILARVVATLAAGKPVTLPFAPGARGYEWSETFAVGLDRIDREPCVMHAMTTRKNGVVKPQTADSSDWSLGDMLDLINEWGAETGSVVVPTLTEVVPGTPTIDALTAFATGDQPTLTIGTTVWSLAIDDGVPKITTPTGVNAFWTLDETVMKVRAGR